MPLRSSLLPQNHRKGADAAGRTLLIAVLVILAALSATSLARNRVWQDEVTAWGDMVAKGPGKARGYFNLGCAHARLGNFSAALGMFNRAIALEPDYYEAYVRRGNVYDDLGMTEQALADYGRVIRTAPAFGDVYYDRGLAYERLNRVDDARADYRRGCGLGCIRACEALDSLLNR